MPFLLDCWQGSTGRYCRLPAAKHGDPRSLPKATRRGSNVVSHKRLDPTRVVRLDLPFDHNLLLRWKNNQALGFSKSTTSPTGLTRMLRPQTNLKNRRLPKVKRPLSKTSHT